MERELYAMFEEGRHDLYPQTRQSSIEPRLYLRYWLQVVQNSTGRLLYVNVLSLLLTQSVLD